MKMKTWQATVLVCTSLFCLSACKNQTTSEADKQNGDKQAQVSSQVAKKGEEVPDFELTGVDGKTYRLSDRLEPHFNQYRHHLIGVLMRGVKYQFADFFKNGQTLLKDILPLKETA